MDPISIGKTLTVAGVPIKATTHAASFVTDPIRAGKYQDIRFQFVVPATGTPNGVWTLEASEDSRVEDDILRGTSTAKWVTAPLSGDTTVSKTAASSGATVNASDITSDGTTVLEAVVKVKSPFGYLRWRWTRSSGTNTSIYILRSGRGA